VGAGANPQWIARTHYDSNSLARVRIFGAVLNRMVVDPSGRAAVLSITRKMAADAGGTYDDTEGLINFPLSVRDVVAVAFLKEQADREWRVSLRSKGTVDVGAIARSLDGGGHANAAGCSAAGEQSALEAAVMARLREAIDASVKGTDL
jgi:phosphoesterase RecJ-like protein